MAYQNIVFVKLEKRLLNDHRWYTMSENAQLLYIKVILLAAETYNKMPKNLDVLMMAVRTTLTPDDFKTALDEIKANFKKFKSNKHFYYFDEFENKTNFISKKKLPSNSLAFAERGTEEEKKKKRKDKEEEEEKREIKPISSSLPKVQRPEETEPDKITKLFITTWQRTPKNYSEILAVEKMICEYTEAHIVQAFRRAAEMDKMNVAYVKGILKSHYEDLAKKKEKQEAAIKKAETTKAAQTTELIQPGQLTGVLENKFKMFDDKPKKETPEIDRNTPEYRRKLSLMNLQIDNELRKEA